MAIKDGEPLSGPWCTGFAGICGGGVKRFRRLRKPGGDLTKWEVFLFARIRIEKTRSCGVRLYCGSVRRRRKATEEEQKIYRTGFPVYIPEGNLHVCFASLRIYRGGIFFVLTALESI